MKIDMKKKRTIVFIAIVPAVLFGGFFMAESFITSAENADGFMMADAVSSTGDVVADISMSTVELSDSITIVDSVEVEATSP